MPNLIEILKSLLLGDDSSHFDPEAERTKVGKEHKLRLKRPNWRKPAFLNWRLAWFCFAVASAATALYIFSGWSENGRWRIEGKAGFVIDSRTGDVYPRASKWKGPRPTPTPQR